MKTACIILVLAGFGAVLIAQTNTPPAAKAVRGETHIYSTSLEVDYPNRTTIYTGNVRVDDPQLKLTCARLTARFMTNAPQLQIESIVAETNVVVDALDWEGVTNHCTAEKLVYSYSVIDSITNQTLELTGNPQLTNSVRRGGLSGTLIIVDLVKGKMFAFDQQTSFSSGAVKSFGEEFDGKKKQPDKQPTPESK